MLKTTSNPAVGPAQPSSAISLSQLNATQLNSLREQLEKVLLLIKFRKQIYFKPRIVA